MQGRSALEMMEKMKAGIEHQAKQTAEDIKKKADEEASRLLQKKVYNEKAKIKEDNKQTKKQILSQKSVQVSVAKGKQQMKILKIRNEAIDKALKKAEERLQKTAASAEYKGILFNLCLEGLLALREKVVEIAVRKCDADEIKNNIQKLKDEYHQKTDLDVELTLSDYVVPDECIGGCVLISQEGKIQISNTLMDRLHLACKDLYPEIRKIFLSEKAN